MTPLAMGLCALSGCTTGLAAAVVWLLLNLPSRVMDVFAFHGPRRCGWALALGMALGAFAPMAGVSAPLGQAAGAAALLLGGGMTGMLASALAEAADVLPQLMHRLRLTRAAVPMCWALALGKAAGAFAASYWTLWPQG